MTAAAAVRDIVPVRPCLPVDPVLAAAQAFIGVSEQGGANRGQMVELFLRGVGLSAGEPWCAAFVHHVGYWALYDPEAGRSAWPLPATGACAVLGEYAGARGMLAQRPVRGDVFLMYFPELRRFAHTGFILSVTETPGAYVCTTLEGNTNDDGSRDGWRTLVKVRAFRKGDGHTYIQWSGRR